MIILSLSGKETLWVERLIIACHLSVTSHLRSNSPTGNGEPTLNFPRPHCVASWLSWVMALIIGEEYVVFYPSLIFSDFFHYSYFSCTYLTKIDSSRLTNPQMQISILNSFSLNKKPTQTFSSFIKLWHRIFVDNSAATHWVKGTSSVPFLAYQFGFHAELRNDLSISVHFPFLQFL